MNASQQRETYGILKALDFPIEEEGQKDPVASSLDETPKEDIIVNQRFSKDLLDRKLKIGQYKPLELRAKESNIAVICSDYMRSTAIQDIQELILNRIREINKKGPFSAETVKLRPSITLNEFASGRTPDCRFICSFPFFLTKYKEQNGYMVAPYGHHKKVCLLASKQNKTLADFAKNHVKSGNNLNLVKLLKFIEDYKQTVYCHANYSMVEMIDQCIEEQSIKFTQERVQRREQIEYDKEEGIFGFVKEYFAEEKRGNWIILIDAGDLRVIEENIELTKQENIELTKQNESKPKYNSIIECQKFFVEHTMKIPVGIGFHPDCALWCDDDMRSQRISELALSFLKDKNFVDELKNMGIEPLDTSTKPIVVDFNEHAERLRKSANS